MQGRLELLTALSETAAGFGTASAPASVRTPRACPSRTNAVLKQDYMLPEFRGSQLRPLVRYFVVAAVRHRPARRRISGFSQRQLLIRLLALQVQFFLEMGSARVGLMSPAPGRPSE